LPSKTVKAKKNANSDTFLFFFNLNLPIFLNVAL
jgi:hypothetical protein